MARTREEDREEDGQTT